MTQTFMRALRIAGALSTIAVVGCNVDQVLKVEPSSLIPAGGLEVPANAAILVAGAASDFDCAFGSYVVVTGMIGEELDDALQTAARWPYDQRAVLANQSFYAQNSCTGLGIYSPLHTARVSANNVRQLLESWSDVEVGPLRQQHIARMAAYEGWSTLLLGEAFQENVLSTVTGEVVNYAGRSTRAEVLQAAVAKLTEAIAAATTAGGVAGDSIRYFALVGRARAYHNLGDMTNASGDATAVPAAFVWNATASAVSARRTNRVFDQSNNTSVSATVGPRYRTLNDPRVPVQPLLNTNGTQRLNALGVPLVAQRKYQSASASIPVAQGAEMQLLIAEADRTTNSANTISIINTFRTAGNQGNYTGATDAASLLTEIIDQRRRALWLTGTHFGDIIRYNLTVTPAVNTMAPWNQQYGPDQGSQMLLPLPEVEIRNNPQLSG
jgi:starch-binding outer membrane protein, SusD/RagB family